MSRRVALARAVVLEPELILYDEPFAGLDPISMGITARLIRDLADRLHCASVLITHDVQESLAIADQVYLVGQGRLVRSEEHTSELQSLMRTSYAVFCLNKKLSLTTSHFHHKNKLL